MGLGSVVVVAASHPPCDIDVNRTDVGTKPSTPPPLPPLPLLPSPLGVNVTLTTAHLRTLVRMTRPMIGLGHPYDDNHDDDDDAEDKNGWSCEP
jgi:hypothetical protein